MIHPLYGSAAMEALAWWRAATQGTLSVEEIRETINVPTRIRRALRAYGEWAGCLDQIDELLAWRQEVGRTFETFMTRGVTPELIAQVSRTKIRPDIRRLLRLVTDTRRFQDSLLAVILACAEVPTLEFTIRKSAEQLRRILQDVRLEEEPCHSEPISPARSSPSVPHPPSDAPSNA